MSVFSKNQGCVTPDDVYTTVNKKVAEFPIAITMLLQGLDRDDVSLQQVDKAVDDLAIKVRSSSVSGHTAHMQSKRRATFS